MEEFLIFCYLRIFNGPCTVNIHAGLACEKVGKASHKAIHISVPEPCETIKCFSKKSGGLGTKAIPSG